MFTKPGGVAIALLALAGCSSATDPDQEIAGGTYDWVESSGGIGGFRYTPADRQYSVRLVFSDGKVQAFRNDSLKVTSTVSVAGDRVTFEPAIDVFTFGGFDETSIRYDRERNRIVLSEGCCDRFQHEFVRR